MLETALVIALDAAKGILRIYAEGSVEVEYKGKNDPVTRADRESNALICAALSKAYPGVPVVAEESDPATFAGHAREPAVWFVDPLDGTREFIARNGEFAVMIGLAEEGRATLGVVVCPALGRSFIAADGVGAFEVLGDGSRKPLHVSSVTALEDAELVVSRHHRAGDLDAAAERRGVRKITACGSAGVKAARVAAGEADVYAQPGLAGKRWDACAPEAIVRGAGGRFTDATGAAFEYRTVDLDNARGLVATNGKLHAPVLDLLQERPSMGRR